MGIYLNEEYLNETRSEAIQDLKNRTKADKHRYFHDKTGEKIFGDGIRGSEKEYEKLRKEHEKASKPMRTADDYRQREAFYKKSNDYQSAHEEMNDKRRKFAKRPITGAIQRNLNKYVDNKYRKSDRLVRRGGTGADLYNNGNYCDTTLIPKKYKKASIKEACEYILDMLDEEYYYNEYED
jgi:hypothetical protein